MYREDSDNGESLGRAKVLEETDKAIYVQLLDDKDAKKIWIPKSVIHDDSEVQDAKLYYEGELLVRPWFARKLEDAGST